jgi:hypothetical protein
MFRFHHLLGFLVALAPLSARAQEVESHARGDLGKTAFIVKASDGSRWVFLRITRNQSDQIRNQGSARNGDAVETQLTSAQVKALTEAVTFGSPPQQLKFRVAPSELLTVSGSQGKYLGREMGLIQSHVRQPANAAGGGAAPPAAVVQALPKMIGELPGRDEDR